MTDDTTTTPDTMLVRLGTRVARLTPDTRPSWWRIDPATCVRRAEEIEIRAAVLAAAANGGGSRLLAVLRAATLDGASTPLADAVMLALALGDIEKQGDIENSSLPLQPEDGWTRVRFGHAVASAPTEETGEDIARRIEAMLARVASQVTDAKTDLPAGEPRSAAAAPQSSRSDRMQERLHTARSTLPEDRTGAFTDKSLPVVPTRFTAPRSRNPAQPDVSAPRAPATHARLSHRRLMAQPAHAGSANEDQLHADTPRVPPSALREPAASRMGATPAATNQPDMSFPTIFSGLPAAALATRLKLASKPPHLDQAAAKEAPPSRLFAPWSSSPDPQSDSPSAPLAGRGSAGLDAPPLVRSWPREANYSQAPHPATDPAPVPALPDADTLLSILARALVDECDHRGLD